MSSAPLRFQPSGNKLSEAQRSEARLFCLKILRDPEYREMLHKRAIAGVLPPAMESMLWHYAYGKPPDRIEIGLLGGEADLEHLSAAELAERAQALAQALLQPAAPPSPEAQEAQAAKQVDAQLEKRIQPKPASFQNGRTSLKRIGEMLEAEGLEEEGG